MTSGRTAAPRVFIALGSNLGDRAAHLEAALRGLAELPGTAVVALSRVYETDPVGPPPQGPYLNAVAEIRTGLDPSSLLFALQAIEASRGRERGRRDAARTLDLDLLVYGERRIEGPTLVVPHPRLTRRGFVLEPLRDLAPRLRIPGCPATVEQLAKRLRSPSSVRPWSGRLAVEEVRDGDCSD